MSEKYLTYTDEEGNFCIVVPVAATLEQAAATIPSGTPYEEVRPDALPSSSVFRNAWKQEGDKVVVDLTEARKLTHDKRRQTRTKELEPLDMKTLIPGEAEAAEQERVKIRAKYAEIQVSIDNAEDVDELEDLFINMK